MVERSVCNGKAKGSIPLSSIPFFCGRRKMWTPRRLCRAMVTHDRLGDLETFYNQHGGEEMSPVDVSTLNG